MKIEINSHGSKLTLTDEELNNSNFIQLQVEKDDYGEVIVPIDELTAAVEAFSSKKFVELERDNLLK